jgi:hypothetical protein
MRFVVVGLLVWSWPSSWRFSWSAAPPADGLLAACTAWRRWWARVTEPVPRLDVALPPAGIRFIWLGIADVGAGGAGAGVLAPGDDVDGAGCAQTGAQSPSAATTAAPIKRCFMV